MRLQNTITQKRLQELLSYDPETGLFTNLTQRSIRVKIGSIAGCKKPSGAIEIRLDYKLYFAHRLAWLYIYGKFPEKGLDHINGVKDDNRISNLRRATRQKIGQNVLNPGIDNTCGYLGVCWHKAAKKWNARIGINGKQKNLGYYITAEEAHEAYLTAKRENHPFWVEKEVA